MPVTYAHTPKKVVASPRRRSTSFPSAHRSWTVGRHQREPRGNDDRRRRNCVLQLRSTQAIPSVPSAGWNQRVFIANAQSTHSTTPTDHVVRQRPSHTRWSWAIGAVGCAILPPITDASLVGANAAPHRVDRLCYSRYSHRFWGKTPT